MLAQRVSDVVVELRAGFFKVKRLEIVGANVVIGIQVDGGETGIKQIGVYTLESEFLRKIEPESVRDNIEAVAVEANACLIEKPRTEQVHFRNYHIVVAVTVPA